jgi:hypothetical protein
MLTRATVAPPEEAAENYMRRRAGAGVPVVTSRDAFLLAMKMRKPVAWDRNGDPQYSKIQAGFNSIVVPNTKSPSGHLFDLEPSFNRHGKIIALGALPAAFEPVRAEYILLGELAHEFTGENIRLSTYKSMSSDALIAKNSQTPVRHMHLYPVINVTHNEDGTMYEDEDGISQQAPMAFPFFIPSLQQHGSKKDTDDGRYTITAYPSSNYDS